MLSGIAPPQIRLDVATDIERTKVQADHSHPMYNTTPAKFRLKSRKSFLKTNKVTEVEADQERIKRGRQSIMEKNENDTVAIEPKKDLHRGKTLPWNLWRTINRIKAECGRTRKNLFKWDLSKKCKCGRVQDDKHIHQCPNFEGTSSKEDMNDINDIAIQLAAYWTNKI